MTLQKRKRELEQNIEQAASSDGILERPTAQSRYLTPKNLVAKNGQICLSEFGQNEWHVVEPRKKLFEDFLNLAYATDEKILRYAKKFGLLDLCRAHLAPASHNIDCETIIPTRKVAVFSHESERFAYNQKIFSEGEPLQEWRKLSRCAQAVLNVSANLKDNKLGAGFDWKRVHKYGYCPDVIDYWSKNEKLVPGWQETQRKFAGKPAEQLAQKWLQIHTTLEGKISRERSYLQNSVNHWLQIGNVRPVFGWNGDKPEITFESGGADGKLAANLAIQLMFAASRSNGVAICSNCGKPFSPKRQPRETQRRYCTNCKQASLRDAKRDQRKRDGIKI